MDDFASGLDVFAPGLDDHLSHQFSDFADILLHFTSFWEAEAKAVDTQCHAFLEVKAELWTTLYSLMDEYSYPVALMQSLMTDPDKLEKVAWLASRIAEFKIMTVNIFKRKEYDLASLRQAAADLKILKEKQRTYTTSAEKLCKREGIVLDGIREQYRTFTSDQDIGGSSSSRQSVTFEGTEETEMVGFKEEVHKLLGMLDSEGKGQLEIISIVGAAGGGKTTLAREVYDHSWTSQSFEFRAWVNVSQQYDETMKRNLLISILQSAYSGAHRDYEKSSDDELGEETFKFLKGIKYLIVMDDVWSTEAWDDIQRSLPKEGYGSKLLLTSRLPVKPNYVHCIDPLHLSSLSKDCSWELLRKKVFGQNCFPSELVGIGEHIVEKCQGLPLAIVAIAGILAMKEKKLEVWKEVSNHLNWTIAENLDGCMRTYMTSAEKLWKREGIVLDGLREQYRIFTSDQDIGKFKLNTDGSWSMITNKAGFGGLLRDEQGNWMAGYYGRMNAENSLEAEIWSIYQGLSIFVKKGFKEISVETDSLIAKNLIEEGEATNHPQATIINEARQLLERSGSTIGHIGRDANQCADHMAQLGAEQEEDLVITFNSPLSIREFLLRDKLGDSSSSRWSITFEGAEKEVVGFKEEVNKLLGMLHSEGNGQLEIISIVGAAGSGKTTLAREVYDHSWTSQSFEFRAWVNVSQQYDETMKRNLLISILQSAYSGAHRDYEKSSDDELGEETLNFLKGKKYLIVMDDVWSTEAWDDIQRSLPKECYGSKLLLTSRLPVQPNYLHCIDPLHLASLSKDCSSELLRKKIFGQNCFPSELVGIGEHIAEKCQGLPLAIVAIASILAKKEKKLEVWMEVSNHLSSTIAENLDGCMGILELSYNHLPLHLKDCFLYIGGFPEASEILVHELISLWIGEGFIQQSEGDKSLEDIAEDYLSNLIKRNLVMVARNRSFRGIKACCIHDLLREVCLKKAKENDFLMQIYKEDDDFSPSATLNDHRLFIGSQFFHELSSRACTQTLHSFLCLNLQNFNSSSFELDLSFFVENFKLLRVLSFASAVCRGEIGEEHLALLRYLAFQIPHGIAHFQLPFLFDLETLHLQARFFSSAKQRILLPRNILKMVKLRHLYAKKGIFQYHHDDWDSLDEERRSGFENSSKLDSLLTLHSICSCRKCANFLARTPNLRKLRICGVTTSDVVSKDNVCPIFNPDLEFLKCLETLYLDGCSNYNELKFPLSLMQLTLKTMILPWKELSSLQTLPRLEVLKLLRHSCVGKIWDMSELEGFPQLKYLRLQGLEIKIWQATEEHFPKLEVLVVDSCFHLKQIPIEFANLNELRKIEVRRCSPSVEESARKIQEERINESGDDGRIQLFAEDNFY